jgi:hypothetical protein
MEFSAKGMTVFGFRKRNQKAVDILCYLREFLLLVFHSRLRENLRIQHKLKNDSYYS